MLRSELYLQRWYSQLVTTTTISMHHHEQESNRGKHIQDRLHSFILCKLTQWFLFKALKASTKPVAIARLYNYYKLYLTTLSKAGEPKSVLLYHRFIANTAQRLLVMFMG